MKKRLSLSGLGINLFLAFITSFVVSQFVEINPLLLTFGMVGLHTVVTYFKPIHKGVLQEGLLTEVWTSQLIENPLPDHSFVLESQDLSEWVEHNTINLVEAGVEPTVYENYFEGNEDPLPVENITDIPHSVVLKTYSTAQTRHRSLQEIELSYKKMQSVLKRHKDSLAKNMGARAAFAWTPAVTNAFNKLMNLTADDSIIDAVIDLKAFFGGFDMSVNLNVCFNADHLARIRKEDKKLYKEILNEKQMYGFKVHEYSKTPLFTSAGTKKPMGSAAEAGDKKSSFLWSSDETFRCLGDVDMYATLKDSGLQADTVSFAQRALIGAMRANNPKYFAGII
ncbi:hypothetical protein [Chryseobacterium daeguense]|uniref:hypothetical protein n=1 Tax=Chryseobacterium daeguense TaxID=412438 RepID=UPI0004183FEA|nr:hypothetical protein [Chryseobacterium daeguense]